MLEIMLLDATPTGLEGLGTLLTNIWLQVTTLVTTIASSPLLLIPVGMGFAGGVIGLGKRLMGAGRRRR